MCEMNMFRIRLRIIMLVVIGTCMKLNLKLLLFFKKSLHQQLIKLLLSDYFFTSLFYLQWNLNTSNRCGTTQRKKN